MIAGRLAIAAALLAAGAAAGWTVRDWRADADALEAAQQHALVLAANAAETDRRLQAQQEAANAAETMRRRAAADAAAARDVTGRLRDHAVALGAQCGPAAASDGPAGATAGDLLADMLVRTSQAAGVLAATADERQAALTECAARYDALSASGAAR